MIIAFAYPRSEAFPQGITGFLENGVECLGGSVKTTTQGTFFFPFVASVLWILAGTGCVGLECVVLCCVVLWEWTNFGKGDSEET